MQLTIENLATGYEERVISRQLDFSIPEHKITALIGANGCGKSTLLKTICRIIPPLGGDVRLGGQLLSAWDSRELARHMGILPQNPTAPGELTVEELVMFGRAPYRASFFARSSKKDRDMVQWALAETDMAEFAKRPVQELSGGQRQRAWIAMAIAQDTEILFLDEPTSFLDVAHQMEVLQLVLRLNRQHGKTIIMVIHELNEAARVADHLIAMKKGEIRYSGSPAEVFNREMLGDIFGIDAELLQDPRSGKPFCIPYPQEG
ncbi:MAG: ABC transporter ATP-binding protein [Acidaminococcus sp.]|uniref:ABC transporter ATP-binding protein n=1 Tax=Acidaminococcus sp. TaxID=1872103 RepID=UPI003F171027